MPAGKKAVEKRRVDRAEDAEVWEDEEREVLLKIGPLFEKYNRRHGTPAEDKPKTFLEELGIKI